MMEQASDIELVIHPKYGSLGPELEELKEYHELLYFLAHMNSDGGFVFRRNESFCYGHEEMYSGYI